MSKTLELRKLIKDILLDLEVEVFFDDSTDKAKYPYIVYSFESTNFSNNRDDIILAIDIWDRNESTRNVEVLADGVEALFNFENKPTNKILPTFYLEGRYSLKDEDKKLKRRQIKISIKNYYIGG